MKLILTLLLAIISLNAKSQDSGLKDFKIGIGRLDTVSPSLIFRSPVPYNRDTSRCILILCDTSDTDVDHGDIGIIYWIKGYQFYKEGWYVGYLDMDKKPLSPSVLVLVSIKSK